MHGSVKLENVFFELVLKYVQLLANYVQCKKYELNLTLTEFLFNMHHECTMFKFNLLFKYIQMIA